MEEIGHEENVAMFEKISSNLVSGLEEQVFPLFTKNEIWQHLVIVFFPKLKNE